MSQAETLRALDAAIRGSMQHAGLVDGCSYWPREALPDAVPTPCTIYVDRDTRIYGDDDAEVATPHTVLTFFRSEVEPERGARVVIDPEGAAEEFKLEAELSKDESRARWVVMS